MNSTPQSLLSTRSQKNINEETELNWWVKETLHTQDQIISGMEWRGVYAADTCQGGAKNKYWRTTHKFGIEEMETLEDALDINHKTGTE